MTPGLATGRYLPALLIMTDGRSDGDAALPLVDALMAPQLQRIAWSRHGFHGPLGLPGEIENPAVADRILPRIDAVLPMPDIATMLALLDRIAS